MTVTSLVAVVAPRTLLSKNILLRKIKDIESKKKTGYILTT